MWSFQIPAKVLRFHLTFQEHIGVMKDSKWSISANVAVNTCRFVPRDWVVTAPGSFADICSFFMCVFKMDRHMMPWCALIHGPSYSRLFIVPYIDLDLLIPLICVPQWIQRSHEWFISVHFIHFVQRLSSWGSCLNWLCYTLDRLRVNHRPHSE